MNPETGFASINGAQLYYELAGAGPSLMFIHAGIADSGTWDDQVPEFARRYRTLRCDLRGFGKSEPVDREFSYREDVLSLLDYLNIEQTILIGCSMGGTTCMDVAIEHPDRVSALVMVGSGPSGLELDVPEPPQVAEINQAMAEGNWDRLNDLAVELWFDGDGRTPDQVDQQARARLHMMSRRVIDHMRKQLGTQKPPMQPSAVEQLGSLDLPVLIVYGDKDTEFIQASASYMEQHIPGAKKVLMPNTAHLPNMERPTEFNRIVLEFLQA